MADDQQPHGQNEAAPMSLTKGDIPALVKAVAEELGPWIDKVVPGKYCIKVGIFGRRAVHLAPSSSSKGYPSCPQIKSRQRTY